MPRFSTEQISLDYDQYGARANPTVLMIHGLTCQSIHWPRPLVDRISAAGYRVVVFDNRDVGLSTRLDHLAVGSMETVLANAAELEAPYGLGDMARDSVALLDHLGQSGAHVVGFSMGGMIAQRMALDFPQRAFSLTSIASSTGDPDLPGADPAAIEAFISTPPAGRDAAIAHLRAGWRAIGGRRYDSADVGLGRLAEAAWDRGYSAAGAARQLLAILRAEPRGAVLEALQVPGLVIHGALDPLVPLAAGERTAACIPRSQLVTFDDLGHDLPDPLLDAIADAIVSHLNAAHASR
ncbi:MAG: alpha/beta hydrolase [Pseudomonadales bacterium]